MLGYVFLGRGEREKEKRGGLGGGDWFERKGVGKSGGG